jgi:hypothetical protein
VALAFGATPFDVEGEGLRWTHRGELCTFDAMVEDFGLGDWEPLTRLATIVRGADTDRVKIAPEAAGLLALSLGLSRMFEDDHAQLEEGMLPTMRSIAGAAMPMTKPIIGHRIDQQDGGCRPKIPLFTLFIRLSSVPRDI